MLTMRVKSLLREGGSSGGLCNGFATTKTKELFDRGTRALAIARQTAPPMTAGCIQISRDCSSQTFFLSSQTLFLPFL